MRNEGEGWAVAERRGECRVVGLGCRQTTATDCTWPTGLGSLGVALAESLLFPQIFYISL